MSLPVNVGTGLVTGRLIRAIVDGPDDDRDPDGVAVSLAKITFTASVSRVVNRSSAPPVMIMIDPIVVTTDEDGELISPDGQKGVRLVATDDLDLSPSGFTYKVTVAAPSLSTQSWSITVPEGSVQDLATAIPVPSNPGKDVAQWEAAVQAVWDARDGSIEVVELAAEVGQQLLDRRGDVAGALDLSGAARNLIVHATLAGDVTVALPADPMVGHTVTLELTQDSTGGRVLMVPGAVTAYGVPVTPAPDPGVLTEVMCFWDGSRWHVRVSGLSDSVPEGW